jgi:hypothetical protein
MSSSPQKNNTNNGSDRAWDRAKAELLTRLGPDGILDIYRRHGLKWPSSGWTTDGNGWSIHRIKGSDSSVKIHLRKGKFFEWNDRSHGSLWDWCALRGGFNDWLDALIHYARQNGVTLPGNGEEYRSRRRCKPIPKDAQTLGKRVGLYTEDLTEMARGECARAARDGHHERLAHELGLCAWAIADCGVSVVEKGDTRSEAFNWEQGYSCWPEWRYTRENNRPAYVSSFMQRRPANNIKGLPKVCLRNRERGLTLPDGWQERVRRNQCLVISEGGSDVAASTSMDLGAIGYPSAGEGAEQLAWAISREQMRGTIPRDLVVIMTQDIDDGTHQPCRETHGLAQELADRLGLPVWVRTMPVNPDWTPPVEKDSLHKPSEWKPTVREIKAYFDSPHWADKRVQEYMERPDTETPPPSKSYKDVRQWFRANCPDAPSRGRGELVCLGDRFIAEVMGTLPLTWGCYVPRRLCSDFNRYRDVPEGTTLRDESTQDDIKKALGKLRLNLDPESELPGVFRQLAAYATDDSLSLKDNPRGCLKKTNCRQQHMHTNLSGSAFWDRPILVELEGLASARCPYRCGRVMLKIDDPHQGRNLTVRCRRWWCEACGHRCRSDWAKQVHAVILAGHAAGAEYQFWIGERDDFQRRVRKTIVGGYFLVRTGEFHVMVVSDRPFTGSVLVTAEEAHNRLIVAIASIRITPPAKGDKSRVRPVTASRCWALRERGKRVKLWTVRGKRKPGQADDFDNVLIAEGIRINYAKFDDPEDVEYIFPASYCPSDIGNSIAWAEHGVRPPARRPGEPIPHPWEWSLAMWDATPSYWDRPDDTKPSRA